MSDSIDEVIGRVFQKKCPKDVVKGVAFNRGEAFLGKEKRHVTLVGLVIISEEPIMPENQQEVILVGAVDYLANQINQLEFYEPPCPLGQLGSAMVNISNMDLVDVKKIIK